MKILVTGGLGFIGSNLVDMLIERGYDDITVIDNLSSESSDKKYMRDGVNYTTFDVLKCDYFPVKFEVIFHLAALARIQPSFERPFLTINNNMMGTVKVCEWAKRAKAKLIYAGSSSFYGDPKLNPYSFSKWQGEEVVLMYNKVYDMNYNIARFFNVYGRRQPREGAYATVVGIFERQWLDGDQLTVTGTGEQKRDFTYVDDICEGLIRLMDKDKQDIFNLGSGRNYSINEIAKMFKDDILYIPKRPGEAQDTLADITKTQGTFGWMPKMNIKRYIDEFKNT